MDGFVLGLKGSLEENELGSSQKTKHLREMEVVKSRFDLPPGNFFATSRPNLPRSGSRL